MGTCCSESCRGFACSPLRLNIRGRWIVFDQPMMWMVTRCRYFHRLLSSRPLPPYTAERAMALTWRPLASPLSRHPVAPRFIVLAVAACGVLIIAELWERSHANATAAGQDRRDPDRQREPAARARHRRGLDGQSRRTRPERSSHPCHLPGAARSIPSPASISMASSRPAFQAPPR